MLYFFYKIICKDLPNDIYVGSTKAFSQRKSRHKVCCNENNTILYNTIRENGGWDNWEMILIEKCECDNSLEAHKKEEEYRLNLNANLNTNKCFISQEQYKTYNKNYYERNKEKMLKQITNNNKNKKDEIKNYQKLWYVNNKKMINCDICNCEIVNSNFNNHCHSKKHISFLKNTKKSI